MKSTFPINIDQDDNSKYRTGFMKGKSFLYHAFGKLFTVTWTLCENMSNELSDLCNRASHVTFTINVLMTCKTLGRVRGNSCDNEALTGGGHPGRSATASPIGLVVINYSDN